MIENDYISERANLLMEFDIPTTAIKKLDQFIPSSVSSENFIEYIKNNKEFISTMLSPYENERLQKEIL